ncbi:MAG TPA: alpha/beta fold hydrolase [Micromonosporaceae bacterium]
MDVIRPEEFDVAVAGGTLRVCRWPGDGPVVLAAHGITANALAWAEVARSLAGRVTLVAPDLRGRAGSRGVAAPYGLAAHADDLVAVLDQLGLDRAPVAGHSMGAFVAAIAAVRHPDRVASVLLVDGGVALPTPPGADIDAILQAVIGPAMQRLSMTFPTTGAYLDFFRAHPALIEAWRPSVAAYVQRDLVGEAPELRSSCVLDAIRADATDTLLDPRTTRAVHDLACPARLLLAERGLLNEPQALYDDARLALVGLDRERVAVHLVPGTNHYTILLEPAAAARVAQDILTLAR